MSATTTAATSVATNGGNSEDNHNTSPSSSPLLFFVALGFGVVFTNLWYVKLLFVLLLLVIDF